MVWQERVGCVVMLTRVFDFIKVYWQLASLQGNSVRVEKVWLGFWFSLLGEWVHLPDTVAEPVPHGPGFLDGTKSEPKMD